ncbi:MAG TPA: cytochrome c [Vicinamibacterales bacterium]|nr:cytochrome c [Vicinamibacterales bacterium]
MRLPGDPRAATRRHLAPRGPLALAVAAGLLAWMTVWAAAPVKAGAPGDELPDGPGKKVLQRACVTCHDLDEVTKFKGYYTRAQWNDIVVTMEEYGADLADGEIDILTQYLADVLGKKE